MKSIKHYVIIGIEVILLGVLGVNASTNVPSHGVSYTNTNSKENISTVEAALNELYNGFKVGTATSAQILSGKTALVQGQTLTGTMANKSGVSQVGNSFSVSESGTIGNDDYAATGSVKVPVAGYYDTGSTLTFDLTDNNNSYYSNGSTNGDIKHTINVTLRHGGTTEMIIVNVDGTEVRKQIVNASGDTGYSFNLIY